MFRFRKPALMAIVALALFPLTSVAQQHDGAGGGMPAAVREPPTRPSGAVDIGKKRADIDLSKPTHFGTVLLPPGRYRVQAVLEGDRHLLVIRDGANDREVGRAPCEFAPADSKETQTRWHLGTDPDGSARLVRVDIRGERGAHVITAPPASAAHDTIE